MNCQIIKHLLNLILNNKKNEVLDKTISKKTKKGQITVECEFDKRNRLLEKGTLKLWI